MSLASLKERLSRLSKKVSSEDTLILQLTNLKKFLQGNNPEDWLEYIQFIGANVEFADDLTRHKVLCQLFDQAFKAVDYESNKTNESYAHLFVNYAQLKSVYVPDDALGIFNQARVRARKFAVVHIASAQFELERDNEEKAMKILEKALLFEVKPTEDVVLALRKLKEGDRNIYISPRTSFLQAKVPKTQTTDTDLSPDLQNVDRLTDGLSDNISAGLSTSYNFNKSVQACHTQQPVVQLYKEASGGSVLKSSLVGCSSDGTVHRDGLRKYSSTPELHSASKRNVNIGLPGRVKKNLEPINIEDEEINTVESFKPIDTTAVTSGFTSHAHTSGYITGTSDSIFAKETKDLRAMKLTSQQKTSPIPEEKMTFMPEKKAPLMPEEKMPLMPEKKVPLMPEEKMPLMPEKKMPIILEEKMPLIPEKKAPLMPERKMSLMSEKKAPFMPEEKILLMSEKKRPLILEEKRPFMPEKNTPLILEEKRPLMSKEKTLLMTEEKTPHISAEDIAPQPIKAYQSTALETPISKGLSTTPMITVNDQQYTILKLLGKGGSSKVYQVIDSNCNIKAIKCVDLYSANGVIADGYKNEIQLLKRLQYCDRVIKLYDSEFKESENMLYVVMEVGFEDLASFFHNKTKDRKLSENLIRYYWEVMLEAVQALHKEGIIHSDLKPANFLLVGGNLKLIDFGIAKALQQDKTSIVLDMQIGTINYMSPEAVMDNCMDTAGHGKPSYKISVKSDVWSLGCILYNMVYGKTPFQLVKHCYAKLQAIISPDFPIDFPDIENKYLIDVMKSCLNRDPKSRPSIDQLLKHPYLVTNRKGQNESPDTCTFGKKLNDKKLETIISTLADQYALSPGGLRNIIQSTMESQQEQDPSMSKGGHVMKI